MFLDFWQSLLWPSWLPEGWAGGREGGARAALVQVPGTTPFFTAWVYLPPGLSQPIKRTLQHRVPHGHWMSRPFFGFGLIESQERAEQQQVPPTWPRFRFTPSTTPLRLGVESASSRALVESTTSSWATGAPPSADSMRVAAGV